jgi:hypothetical protein
MDELTCWRLAGVELEGRPEVRARGIKLAERMDGEGGVELQGGWRGKGGWTGRHVGGCALHRSTTTIDGGSDLGKK